VSRGKVVARNAAFLAGGQAVTWSFTLLFMVIVPRAVGPSEWGEYSLATAVTSVALALSSLGVGTLLVKEVSRDLSRASDYIGAALAAQVLLAIPFLVIVAGISLTINYTAHTRVILAIITVGTLITFITAPVVAGLQAFEQMHYNTLGDVIAKGLVSLAAVVLVLFFAVGIVGIGLVALGATALVAVLEMRWIRGSARVRLRFDWPLIRHLVIGGLPYWATGLFLTIYIWVDSVMLSVMTSTRVVGWYSAPTRLFATMLFVPSILTIAILPALSHSYQHDRGEMGRLVHRSFTLLASLSLPIATGTALLGPAMVRLLFGASYAPSGPVLTVLGLTLVPTYINMLVNQFLVAADRQWVWTRVMAVVCVLNPAINLIAISYFQRTFGNGALGAAWALLATETLMAVAGLVVMPRGLLGRSTLTPVIRSAAVTAVMAGVVWLLRDRFVLVPIVAGASSFAVGAIMLRVFPHEDLALIRELVAKVARRLGLRYRLRSSATNRAAGLPLTMLDLFTEDLREWKRTGILGDAGGDDVLRPSDVVKLLWGHNGVRATLVYRLSAEAKRLRIPIVPGMLARRNARRYGLDIVPSVPIGPGLYIAHTVGTVIMARAIGRNCHIISAVTIGMRDKHEFPVIGDGVVIGAGARVLGGIHLGDGAQIGANAVVICDVPARATAVGVPARLLAPRGDSQVELLPTAKLIPVLADAGEQRNGNGRYAGDFAHHETNGHNGHSGHVAYQDQATLVITSSRSELSGDQN
jgi:serine O-acetyltransferase